VGLNQFLAIPNLTLTQPPSLSGVLSKRNLKENAMQQKAIPRVGHWLAARTSA